MDTRTIGRAAGALLAASLLVACSSNDDATPSETPSTADAAGDSPVDAPSTAPDRGPADTTTTTGPPAEGVIELRVSGGEVTGGGRHEVGLGSRVTLRVTSDVADEVHLHGYDLYLDLQPGEVAELTFEATIPGVFEAELHDAGIVLAELLVR